MNIERQGVMPKRFTTSLFFIMAFSIVGVGCNFRIMAAPLFEDDFEDNDLSLPPPGWADAGGVYEKKTTRGVVDVNLNLELFGPLEGYDRQYRNGLYHFLVGDGPDGGIQPNYVSYTVVVTSTDNPDYLGYEGGILGNFVLTGLLPGGSYLREGVHINFNNRRAQDDTLVRLKMGPGSWNTYGPYYQFAMYTVELKNIDWDASPKPRYDFYVNGALMEECVEFVHPITSFTQLDLYNWRPGQVWYDNFLMTLERVIPCEPPQIPLPPLPSPTATTTPNPTPTMTPTATPPVLDACTYEALKNANCRKSDHTGSSVVEILMRGETAELVALNPESTHGKFELESSQQCWIALSLLSAPDSTEVCEVPVIDPPPPEEPPKPESPEPPECSQELDKDACEASGGVYVEDDPTQASYCSCP
jgi:hypothetical protein